ncbi:MAG: 2-phospho-L-lactate transferase CofD family protein, partial [Myxococcota bacterium]
MRRIRVVLFSGGRGSQVLSKELISDPRIELTLAVNGYDDGKSTGEVRRFLRDCLGPSDFRKNASTLAGALRSCAPELIELLDLRLPEACERASALACLAALGRDPDSAAPELARRIGELASRLAPASRAALARRLAAFETELSKGEDDFEFSDCSLGNLVFAGCYLEAGRRFNAANDDYCSLLELPAGCIENVTDGTNAYLVALDRNQRLLASEADIVDANRRNYIEDIYLIDRRIAPDDPFVAGDVSLGEIETFLREHSQDLPPNERLLRKLEQADLVIYAPGTQHSSLLPSYLTRELSA